MIIDTALVVNEKITEPAVYEIAKVIWEHNEELTKKPALARWTRDTLFSLAPRIPFHPGAVSYYREIGQWTKEMEEWQKGVLKEKP